MRAFDADRALLKLVELDNRPRMSSFSQSRISVKSSLSSNSLNSSDFITSLSSNTSDYLYNSDSSIFGEYYYLDNGTEGVQTGCNCFPISIENFRKNHGSTKLENVIVTYIIPMIMCLGVTGNMIFLIMMARFRQMRSSVNYHLSSLAIADLMALLVGGSDKLVSHYTAFSVFFLPKGFNGMYCIVLELIVSTLFIVSMISITLVTLEMFYALSKPIEHRPISSKKRTFMFISLSWLVSFMVGLVWGFKTEPYVQKICVFSQEGTLVKVEPLVLRGCTYRSDSYELASLTVIFAFFCVALVIDCSLYVLIIYHLRKHEVNAIRETAKIERRRNIRAVSKMIVINGIAFFICLTPWFFGMVLTEITFLRDGDSELYWLSNTLLYINSVINPFIYGTFNARYRAALRKVFNCKGSH